MLLADETSPFLPGLEPWDWQDHRPAPKTFADLREWYRLNPEKSDQAKKVADALLMSLCRVLANTAARRGGRLTPLHKQEIDPAAVSCVVEDVNGLLRQHSRALTGLRRTSFSNALSAYRTAMVALGLAEPGKCPRPRPGSPWLPLLDSLSKFDCLALKRLAYWADLNGISPEGLQDAHRPGFEQWGRSRVVDDDIPGLVAKAFKTFARVRAARMGGPGPLAAAGPARSPRPASAFGQNLAAEVEQIRRMMEGRDRQRPRRRSEAKLLEERTVKIYLGALEQLAGFWLEQGRPPEVTVAELLEPKLFDAFLEQIYGQAREKEAQRRGVDKNSLAQDVGRSAKASQLASGLLWIAAYYLKLDDAVMHELRDVASAYRPLPSSDINPKVRERLDRLAERHNQMRLLWLPDRLFRLAERALATDPIEAALLAMEGVAIGIELRCPLRPGNLQTLQLGPNVVFDPDRPNRPVSLMVSYEEIKNDKRYDWPLGKPTADLIQIYLRRFHPILAPKGSRWLFPSGDGEDRPRAMSVLAGRITRRIDAEVGVEVNLHLFRAFAVCLRLEEGSHVRAEMRMLLGHKSFATTERYYTYIRTKVVAARHETAVTRARREAHPYIKQWLAG